MGNPVDPGTYSDFGYDELQLAVDLGQLVHMTAENTPEFWIQLEHVHGSTGSQPMETPWRTKIKDGRRMVPWIGDVRGLVFKFQLV